ncbi:bifunctional 2-polyprenyl-6-hydroxyphenol methylase/3-demethylubiquinol 3-O-methyltransferase UbiG [Roseovarius sp. MMSF_3448]|uniref:class I SAM-dependent methyltransferase n=1 Tax=Roseovarius sp. MMSF_3448 TaxID=3046713 RepID=UPI00273D39ED|nr:class I SAM-dependent methyltransferase [Roseovarius sp. MMSF_3448]
MKILKRIERYISAVFTLGRTKGLSKDAHVRIDHLSQDMRSISEQLRRHETLAEDLVADYGREKAALERFSQSQTALLARMFADLSRRLDEISNGGRTTPETASVEVDIPTTRGLEVFKDNFYHRFENRYRGTPEEIARRLKVYLPDVEAAWLQTAQKPVLDLGCGRGEWLGLLAENGIRGFGVDLSAVQIEEAVDKGLDVRQGNALQALADQEDNSLSVVSAHHLIEHLPFDAVAWITREALRVLAPGGLLLFETPNTRNVLVGATTFHTDPTHLKPMPEQVMEVLLETAGFDPVQVHGLNPHERFGEFVSKSDFNDELASLMFGPQDLAVLGSKPIED